LSTGNLRFLVHFRKKIYVFPQFANSGAHFTDKRNSKHFPAAPSAKCGATHPLLLYHNHNKKSTPRFFALLKRKITADEYLR